ncbi:MAG TPA: sigma-70 family RNA polymerase sigma factor [Chloroflexota bacterium]
MELREASDVELVRLLARRDDRALRELYDRYGRLAYSLAFRVLREREAAEEVVQDVFLKLWRDPDRYVPERGPFWTWLLSVVRHQAIDTLRSRHRHDQGARLMKEKTGIVVANDDPDEVAWLSERRARVRSALARLPEAQREAIELAYFEGLTQSEMAELLHEPLGTIKTRVRRGIQRLRALLDGHDGEAES